MAPLLNPHILISTPIYSAKPHLDPCNLIDQYWNFFHFQDTLLSTGKGMGKRRPSHIIVVRDSHPSRSGQVLRLTPRGRPALCPPPPIHPLSQPFLSVKWPSAEFKQYFLHGLLQRKDRGECRFAEFGKVT